MLLVDFPLVFLGKNWHNLCKGFSNSASNPAELYSGDAPHIHQGVQR